MKSIGNGWRRAQEAMSNAKKREGDYILRECVVNHNIQPILDRLAAQNQAAAPFQQAEINSMPYAEYVLHRQRTTVSGQEHREAQKSLKKRFAGLIERIKNVVL